ncbi:MAG: MmcQ/YjbR family DNA-binding protein [Bacteroidota bacterium]|nr:MmcQ/YjbR family DNA-binding protein [Bacteroidota bacterium]
MDIAFIRDYCLSKNGVTEAFPFDNETLVFKVMGKVFLLIGINSNPIQFNVKCAPELAIEFREKYDFVLPGYHMNKKHWNTIIYNGSNAKILKEMIDASYNLVVAGLPKSTQSQFIK